MNINDISVKLNINPETVRRWIRTGELKSSKIGMRYMIKKEDLEVFIKNKSRNRCIICKAIKDSVFPFISKEDKYYLDSEGCIDEYDIRIFFCPLCGRKI